MEMCATTSYVYQIEVCNTNSINIAYLCNYTVFVIRHINIYESLPD